MKTYILSGAGSGIGRAIAVNLSKIADSHVVLIGRNASTIEETRSQMDRPDRHSVVAKSVTDAEGLRSEFKALELADRNTVGVITNAGVGGPNIYGDEDRWDEIIDINVKGSYILGNEALPYLQAAKDEYKHVVLISSIVAHLGVPFHSAYCTSKAAVLGLMRSWAAQWAESKVLVNAICPGWVDTQMARNGIQGIADGTGASYDEALKGQMGLLPLKKMSEPSEIAALVDFLISNKQVSITGEEFQINNGGIMH